MRRDLVRKAVRTSCLAIALSATSWVPLALAAESTSYKVDVQAQPLADSLRDLGRQTETNVIFQPALVKGMKNSALRADLTAEEALGLLLKGTGLAAERTSPETVVIKRSEALRASAKMTATGSVAAGTPSAQGAWQLAQTGAQSSAEGASSSAGGAEGRLEEVIVTAQKREERLQDVPVPATAISSLALVESNQIRLQDYSARIPGLSVVPGPDGTVRLTVRGLTTGNSGNPTVGVTVDDVPFGSSTGLGGGGAAPDFDPSDLERIEVLRGPQGTLYGASSLGGLLKYVTVDPSTDRVYGVVRADMNNVRNGDGPGYGARASVNVPLSDSFAIRASGFGRRDVGYIDNVVTDREGANRGQAVGAHVSGLWRPSEDISLKLGAIYQDTLGGGASLITSQLGDLQQDTANGGGGFHTILEAYSATYSMNFGAANLVALSGYNVTRGSGRGDLTGALGDLSQLLFGERGTIIPQVSKSTKFSQEIRFSTPIGSNMDWLVGAFYTNEHSRIDAQLYATVPATGRIVGVWLEHDRFPTTYKEYAAFTDLTYRFSDRFDVQVGGRESQNKQSYSEDLIGQPYDFYGLGLNSPVLNPLVHSKDNSFTFLVTPRFKITTESMVYARVASGYRSGGPNADSTVFDLRSTFKPDTTLNYEIGFKSSFLDQRVTLDTSIYRIDWKDIQLGVIDPRSQQSYTTNASRAKSEGLEISVEAKPFTSLTLSAWAALNRAVLVDGFPPLGPYGVAGDRLPNSSRVSGRASADWDFPVSGGVAGFAGVAVSYTGNKLGNFTGSPTRQTYGGFTQTDLHAGFNYDLWEVNLSVNNLTDKRATLNGGIGADPHEFEIIRPRTADLMVSRKF